MKAVVTVGFLDGEDEISPGVFKPNIVEKSCVADVMRNTRRYQQTDKQNVDLTVNNRLSILSDLYMQKHWGSIRYVFWNGVKWQVNSVDIDYPRLTLDLGGVYNENEI